MSFKSSLKRRPTIYEIVPPRRDTSRFNTELRGVESVLREDRVDAINVPELMTRREERGHVHYSPRTIPPEEYALMIKEYKEPIVNMIVPRLTEDDFLARTKKVLRDYGIRNLVFVGKERREDPLPGPSVLRAFDLLRTDPFGEAALGGICIFSRNSPSSEEYGAPGSRLTEARRVWAKARAGCDFVTSQICFDAGPALEFLAAFRKLCDETETDPLTVFISLTTVPSAAILSLVEGLDVVIPPKVKRRIIGADDMGAESMKVAEEVVERIVEESEKRRHEIPLGLQIEQVGVNSGDLSLELLDLVYASIH